jgi:hypothetical protein
MRTLELATVFNRITKAHGTLESTAAQILEVVRLNDANSLDKFNALVAAAYDSNGWSSRQGRPRPGDISAPQAVQVYVSTLRRAYRMGIKVLKFTNMEEIRRELRKTRGDHPEPPAVLKGVQVAASSTLNGAVWHDVLVVWEHIPPEEQQALEASVRRLFEKYVKKAPPALRLVA